MEPDMLRELQDVHREFEIDEPARSELHVELALRRLVALHLEFAVHVLQLTKHIGLAPRLEVALGQLASESLVKENVIEAQQLLTRILVMIRLVAPGDVKPTAGTWQLVAEACGAGSWDELLAEHDAARQSISALWNSIKQEA